MTDFMVTVRKIRQDFVSEANFEETCQLVSGREGLSTLLHILQKDEPQYLCRFVVEVL